ncbi:uncharacterized mitochondrial protein-like protein [Tanacetum coccineum]
METHCVNMELKYQNQALKDGQHGQILNETSNKAKINKEIEALEKINIELEHSVAKLLADNEKLHKENEHLKQTYKDLYDSIKTTRVQTKDHNDSLIAQINSKTVENADLKTLIQEKGFKWGELENKAFEYFKTRLSEATILGLRNFEEMFVVEPLVDLVNNLRHENETLDELRQIRQMLARNKVLDGFQREQGLVLFHGRYFIGTDSKLKELLLSEFHDTPMAGHSRVNKMLVGLLALFYWKRMRKSIEEFIWVWDNASMDFIMGIPIYEGLSVIVVVVDRFTKYAHVGTLPTSLNATKVTKGFMDLVTSWDS